MSTWTIRVDVSGARRKIRAYKRSVIPTCDGALNVWAKETARVLKSTPYPPKRPGQRYVRTGRMASSWGRKRTKRTQHNVEYAITNKATAPRGQTYPSYVVGDKQGRQAWMHRGRWWVAQIKVGDRVPRLLRILKHALKVRAKELGL